MPIKGYIAGRPVSRWEAETDNIDIDYRNLEGHGLGPCRCIEECQTGKKGCALKILVCVVIFFVGIFIGYVIRRNIQPLRAQNPPCPAVAPVVPSIQVKTSLINGYSQPAETYSMLHAGPVCSYMPSTQRACNFFMALHSHFFSFTGNSLCPTLSTGIQWPKLENQY